LVRLRRGTPQNDLISDIAQNDALAEGELLSNLALLLIAGFETTTNLIGNGVMALLRHPEQLQRLKKEPELAAPFVEEFLRYDSPVQVTSRVAHQPTVLDGQPVEAGTYVIALIGSANRDETRFANASEFDPARPNNVPISFGAGAHFCLGAALARLEGQVAFPLLLHRLDGLELAGEPLRRNRLVLRGYQTLPVSWARN
jgi:cytochrome P450